MDAHDNTAHVAPNTRGDNAKYVKAGWVAYAFAVAVAGVVDGPVALIAVAGVGVMTVASILAR